MFRFVPRFAAVLLLVVTGTLAPVAAKERPFKASGEGVVVGALYAPKCQATHLGRSLLFVELGLDLRDYFLFIPDRASFTAANGDQLNFDFDAEAYVVNSQTGIVSTTVTFTGGTGRFRHATGRATATFDVYQYIYNYSYDFSFVIDGSIDY